MKQKSFFEIVVGIATIIGCIATIIGLFMVNKIINNTTTVIDKQTSYNSQNHQLMNFFYNIGTTKIDTIVVNKKDTAFIQTPAPIKIIREDINDTVLMNLPPRRMSPEEFYIENHRKDFTKHKEQNAKESTELILNENEVSRDEANFRKYMKDIFNEHKREHKTK